MRNRHCNNGFCSKCEEIFNTFPGFHEGLKSWFENLQSDVKDAHISSAGRGQVTQDAYYAQGVSKARWGESAHNYNAAIDIFRLTVNGASYDRVWFQDEVGEAVNRHNKVAEGFRLKWYGAPGSRFFELPHVEVAKWESLSLPLVETASPSKNTSNRS